MELAEVQKKIFELTVDGFKKNKEQILKLEQLEEELLRKEKEECKVPEKKAVSKKNI